MDKRYDIQESLKPKLIAKAAAAAHEANRVLCESHGDFSQPRWYDAPSWQTESAIAGARQIFEDPALTPSRSHELWVEHKQAEGWAFGPEKDPVARTHPCMVPYSELSPEHRAKDELFGIVVRAVLGL